MKFKKSDKCLSLGNGNKKSYNLGQWAQNAQNYLIAEEQYLVPCEHAQDVYETSELQPPSLCWAC